MKKPAGTMILLFLTVFTGLSQNNTLETITLPENITQYVNLHFPDYSIVEIEREIEGFQRIFELELNDGTELDFTKTGEPIKIETKNALPVSAVPAPILAYVNANFPQNSIKEWELKKKKQRIKLTNNTELFFDRDGNFLKRH